MKNIIRQLLLLGVFLLPWQAVHSTDSAQWFRKQNVYEAPAGKIFDVPGWRVVLDGPIRASATYDEHSVYIGTAKGNFYSLDQSTGKTIWMYANGSAIHSTAAYEQGKLYFSDNRQTLHCLAAKDGKPLWKTDFGKKLPYEWRFDYYYSSPVLTKNMILVGSDDGFMNALDKANGKQIWKYDAGSIIRATPTIDGDVVYFGDCSGIVHALNITNGKEIWKCETKGATIPVGEAPFDRKAIFAAVAIQGNVCTVGSRDGFFYGINKTDGKIMWSNDYSMSWVLSSAAIKDGISIAGTSDGRFVSATDIKTGKETWRFQTRNIVWASPTIVGNLVYVPSCDGVLHILDVLTGKKVSEYRTTNSMSIFSSPVFTGSAMILATDEGAVLSLEGTTKIQQENRSKERYVLWMSEPRPYFRNGMDVRLRDYFSDNGYQVIDTLGLIKIMTNPEAGQTAIVVTSPVIPDTLLSTEGTSILRQYLESGGKLIFVGMNPLMFGPKKILDIEYGQPDTRAYKGLFPAFPTTIGEAYHLPPFWSAFASVDVKQVDTVLGMDENGLASAWIKHYGKEKKGGLIQVWLEQSRAVDYNFLKNLDDIN